MDIIPKLNKIVDKYQAEDVVFIGISTDDPATAMAAAQAAGFKYQVIANGTDIFTNMYISKIPSHVVINGEGQRIATFSKNSPQVLAGLDHTIKKHLKKINGK